MSHCYVPESLEQSLLWRRHRFICIWTHVSEREWPFVWTSFMQFMVNILHIKELRCLFVFVYSKETLKSFARLVLLFSPQCPLSFQEQLSSKLPIEQLLLCSSCSIHRGRDVSDWPVLIWPRHAKWRSFLLLSIILFFFHLLTPLSWLTQLCRMFSFPLWDHTHLLVLH